MQLPIILTVELGSQIIFKSVKVFVEQLNCEKFVYAITNYLPTSEKYVYTLYIELNETQSLRHIRDFADLYTKSCESN